MVEVTSWHVDIYLSESDGHSHAEARLRPRDEVTLIGHGEARLNPADRDVPEIGYELATARALSDLAHRLLHAATEDIEALTHEHVRLSE